MSELGRQLEIIKRGVVDLISEEELTGKLKKSLEGNKPLIVKAGFDPTASDIHLGHVVLLRKLRQFQQLGHRVVFLIGDFTARIGDPTGRSEIRKQLSREEVDAFSSTYISQVDKLLDASTITVVKNSRWFDSMSVMDLLKLTTHATVSQMIARADFKKRLSKGEDISLLEFMYPLLQGYDSVKLEADIEIGGTDQIFNLLVGRDIQKDFGKEPQVVLTMPLLEGTDGALKMSKSYNNYIGVNESPREMFGKIMSISDDLMIKYYTLLTDEDTGAISGLHPKEAKMRLAENIISQFHSKEDTSDARAEFEKVFSRKDAPSDMPEYALQENDDILSVLTHSGLAGSKNDARRLIKQGAVSLDNERIEKEDSILQEGILKVGSRRFLRIKRPRPKCQ